MNFYNSKNNGITFSIIIPTYNRPQALARCLDSLSQLNYPQNGFEVIVVDDGSRESLEPLLTAYKDRVLLQLIRQKNAGPASARNAGSINAKGTFLAFTDDDCMPAQNWLTELERVLLSAPECMVGGRVVNGLPANIYARASHLVLDIVYAHYNEEGANPRFFASNNMAVPTHVFSSSGGFDVSYPHAGGEDREFCDRWLALGHGMTYAPGAIVHHYHDLTLATFWRQHVAYGKGAFRFNRSHALRGREPSTIRLDFYGSFFPRFHKAVAGLNKKVKCSLLSLMAIWQAANTVGFLSEMVQYFIRQKGSGRN